MLKATEVALLWLLWMRVVYFLLRRSICKYGKVTVIALKKSFKPMDFSSVQNLGSSLPVIYLSAFITLLAGSAVIVIRQVLKNRVLENDLGKLEKRVLAEDCTSQEYYALASIYLDKRLKDKSIAANEFSPVHNALGYAYECQEQYDLAIRNYKEAIKQDPIYVTAMNNLGHAYEQKKLMSQALETYEQALALEPQNETANRRITSLRRRLVTTSS
jgi:tetratricopeptide (TPR) repeat protein